MRSEENVTPLKFIVHWPGKDVVTCSDHLKKLVGLGAVLGIQISYNLAPEEAICSNCQNEALMQI